MFEDYPELKRSRKSRRFHTAFDRLKSASEQIRYDANPEASTQVLEDSRRDLNVVNSYLRTKVQRVLDSEQQ